MEDSNPCNPLEEETVKDATDGELREREEHTLLFLDSLDGYLIQLESLTSTLRQGWLELASGRHSMGLSRLSSTLLDLKVQSAATTVMVNEPVEESQSSKNIYVVQPQFRLSKWNCLEKRKSSPKEFVDEKFSEDRNSSQLTHRGRKHEFEGISESTAVAENVRTLSLSDNSSTTSESAAVDDVNKKRNKSLSVFGALVSPKLRAAQLSFETALETIVEIANMRSSLISSFSQLQNKQ